MTYYEIKIKCDEQNHALGTLTARAIENKLSLQLLGWLKTEAEWRQKAGWCLQLHNL